MSNLKKNWEKFWEKVSRSSFLRLVLLLVFIIFTNIGIFGLFLKYFSEKHYDSIYFFETHMILLCFILIFVWDLLILYVFKHQKYSDTSYNIIIAFINFILVGMTVVLLFGQLYNAEKIEIEDEDGKRYNLLVGKIPHFEVISNPIVGKKDFILEQKNTLDVLKNLDSDTKKDKTLPKNAKKFVEITSIGNSSTLIQILTLFSFTAPRLLMPILIQRKKGDPHYLNSSD